MKSIHEPGYPSLEHLVVDGGSTDGSVEIIRKYQDKLAYFVSEPDEGQTYALVKGFDRATGDIHGWLNSDDLYEPTTLFEVAEFFEANPRVRFVYGDASWIDDEGRFLKLKQEHLWNRFVWLYDHNYVPQPSAFWRADLYREVGGLDSHFDFAMDADLWIRFSDVTRPRHVRRLWSRMRLYPEQKNSRMRTSTGAEGRAIRRRYISYPPPVVRRARRIAARSLRFALKALSGGYPPSEVARHMGTVLGKGTWEQREALKRRNRR